MANKTVSKTNDDKEFNDTSLQLLISDPIDDLKEEFIKRTTGLEKTLDSAIKNQNKITMFVIVVMVIGIILILFSLVSVVIVSWQSNQTVHDAVQLQLNSTSSK